MKLKRSNFLLLIFIFLLAIFITKTWFPIAWAPLSSFIAPFKNFFLGGKTVDQVIETISPYIRPNLKSLFQDKGCSYPPPDLTFLVFKDEKWFEVWTSDKDGNKKNIRNYPIIGLSGGPGPKLKEGDGQVPEGFYRIIGLNPNSQFHLSMKLNYPNEFDKRIAKQEGRDDPGYDIFIHGGFASVGCLAMGDKTIEELFLLSYDTGLNKIRVLISPYDLRKGIQSSISPEWKAQLYENLKKEMESL